MTVYTLQTIYDNQDGAFRWVDTEQVQSELSLDEIHSQYPSAKIISAEPIGGLPQHAATDVSAPDITPDVRFLMNDLAPDFSVTSSPDVGFSGVPQPGGGTSSWWQALPNIVEGIGNTIKSTVTTIKTVNQPSSTPGSIQETTVTTSRVVLGMIAGLVIVLIFSLVRKG